MYRAETPVGGGRLPHLDQCAAFVDEVVGSLWWAARFPEHGLADVPRLRPGQGARQAFYREDPGRPTITLPRRYRTTGVVLHELAHWALKNAHDLPVHGRTFTRLLLDATTEFGGAGRADRLAAGYAEHKVHVGKPARLGPDGRWYYDWDERLRLGRDKALTIRLRRRRRHDRRAHVRASTRPRRCAPPTAAPSASANATSGPSPPPDPPFWRRLRTVCGAYDAKIGGVG